MISELYLQYWSYQKNVALLATDARGSPSAFVPRKRPCSNSATAALLNLVCVAETDMCGVDAIQYLTGCTYGKGNFLHRDHGKMAFSFFDRKRGMGIRLLFRNEARGDLEGEMTALMARNNSAPLSEEEQKRLQFLRRQMQERLMSSPLEELFIIQPSSEQPPRPASILTSLTCEDCGENTLESRTRRYAGTTLCIACFAKVEQKV